MSAPIKRVLFIMCDQLRFDYLSCAGHPRLETPNIDAIAARGVRFTRAYVQSPVCGASRMSFYTGRYVSSHGATWNGVPLKVGEQTLGDFTRALGVQAALVGKTHMKPDKEGMARLGIEARAAQLRSSATPATAATIAAALVRLTAPTQMGNLFKAMAVTHPAWPVPAGFAA